MFRCYDWVMSRDGYKRFHLEVSPEEDALLDKLVVALSAKTGLRISRIQATRLAIQALAKKECRA